MTSLGLELVKKFTTPDFNNLRWLEKKLHGAGDVLEDVTPWWWRKPSPEDVMLVSVVGTVLGAAFWGAKTYVEEIARYEAKKDCEDDERKKK